MPTVERLTFKLKGQTDDSWMQDVQEIIVENSLRMPAMCTITMYDGIQANEAFSYMESSTFVLGAEVIVSVLDSNPEEIVFRGEIVALEPVFDMSGRSALTVRAYDKSHRLHRGKHSRTFLKQKYSDVIRNLLSESGIGTGTITDTKVVHEFLLQNNQTNMEWIAMVADLLGYQYYVDDGKFQFKPADQFEDSLITVAWREDLRSFRPHVTTTHQFSDVSVYAWDPATKKAIVSKVTPSTVVSAKLGLLASNGASTAKSTFGVAASNVVSVPVPDTQSAEMAATGHAAEVEGEFVRADGIALGTSKIKAGRFVDIAGVGKYNGKYFVTSVRHVYRYDGRWETHFSINGRNATSLLSVLRGGQDRALYNNRVNGVVIGIVTNQKDPQNWGRVKVKYPAWPQNNGTEVESDWVRVAAPGAGKERGLYWLPEVNDEVLVAFEYGDPHKPYIVGALWNGKDAPPEKNVVAAPSGTTTQRFLKSRTGHTILIDDSDGAAKIHIVDSTKKNDILIDTKQNSISINADKDITLKAKGNITLDATGRVEIKSGADTLITATAAFKVSAKAPSEIKVTSPLTIDGVNVTVKASAMLSLSANGPAELKSSAIVNVQGSLIKLN